MSDELLIRHAIAWAETKKRALDAAVLGDVLRLRRTHDELADGEWPSGTAERLLLLTWPAYGPPLPDLDVLRETLDSYWGFLRATGRMSAHSASPAELRKEAKRALPKMQVAYDDPAHHSQGRVLSDFGRSIGLDLEGAQNEEDLRVRMQGIQDAWNELPQEERFRLMPDGTPKSARGAAWTQMVNESLAELAADDEPPFRKGELAVSARCVREAPYVQACFALAEWVGAGREVTQAGLLRPAVAREAYQALNLWPWERGFDRMRWTLWGTKEVPDNPEFDRVWADTALNSWRSAGDCIPLDRLWFPMSEAGLIDLGSRRAVQRAVDPADDHEWLVIGVMMIYSLCRRLGGYVMEPILGVLGYPALADCPVPMAEVREWWEERCPDVLRDLNPGDWQGRLNIAVYHFADCGLFEIDDDQVVVTEFGRDCVPILLDAFYEGEF